MNAIFKSSLSNTARRSALLVAVIAIAALCLTALPTDPAKAAAPDGFTSQEYSDQDGNGTIDHLVVVINGGVALTACVVDATEIGTDWTYTANGLTGSSIDPATAACVVGTATITFHILGAPVLTTGVTVAPTIAYNNDDLDNSIANAAGNLGTVLAQNITDKASPIVQTAVYLDSNSDGEVDKVQFNTTADTGLVCTAFTGGVGFTVGTPGTVVLASAAGDTCTGGGASPKFTINLATVGAADTTGGAQNPIATYTQPGNGVEDGALNDVPTAAGVTVTDLANPIMVSATVNKSASRNTVTFVYSEAVNTCTGASTATCGDLTAAGVVAGFTTSFGTPGDATVPTTKNTVSGTGTTTILVTLADQAGATIVTVANPGTSPSGVVTPVVGTAVHDLIGNDVSIVNTPAATVTSAWYLTQPTLTTTTISDADFDGKIDTATLVLTAPALWRDANITLVNATLGGAAVTLTGTADDNTIVLFYAGDALAVNTSATAAQVLYSGAATLMTDIYGNILDTTTDGTIVAADATELDGAPPVIVTTTPASTATGVAVGTSITVNFSESMTIGVCTFTTSPDPGGFGSITAAGNWSAYVVGQATSSVTLADSSAYNRSRLVTITIAGCTALVGGAALHAGPVANPWTFTTVAASGIGGGSTYVEPAVVILSLPNGGETFTTGQQVGITWSSANGAFIKFKVSYSADNGNTWIVLNDALTSSATSYTWTVPSASTTQGKIKVEGIGSNDTVLASDMSEAVFTIAGLTAAPPPVAPPTAPATDSTVSGTYTKETALANTPTIAVDKALSTAASANCTAGTLIKGSLAAVYYCGSDGKRYVFVNDKAYFSWYADFSSVIKVSDTVLASITIGGNVTYRPGTKMVKITSDPKVYAVSRGGILRWVATEAIANSLYGATWNQQIDDVPDSFFVNYTIGSPISS